MLKPIKEFFYFFLGFQVFFGQSQSTISIELTGNNLLDVEDSIYTIPQINNNSNENDKSTIKTCKRIGLHDLHQLKFDELEAHFKSTKEYRRSLKIRLATIDNSLRILRNDVEIHTQLVEQFLQKLQTGNLPNSFKVQPGRNNKISISSSNDSNKNKSTTANSMITKSSLFNLKNLIKK